VKVFFFKDYREFILHKLEEAGGPKGYRQRLSEAAHCTAAFLSQVLNSHVHLTADQAAGIAKFWRLDDEESEYFLDLVQHARASTPSLRALIEKRMDRLRNHHNSIESRVHIKGKLSPENAQRYYTSWIYSAIHVALSVPELQNIPALSARFRLSPEVVQRVLADLETMGLASNAAPGVYKSTVAQIHLPSESPFAIIQHNNWRQKAIIAQSELAPSEMFSYTAVHSLARKDIDALKRLLLDYVEKSNAVVRPSPEEAVVCVLIDLFPV
jgi:uncharacterized protein (TIGR02147 family)